MTRQGDGGGRSPERRAGVDTLRLGGLRLEGRSWAGDETWFRVQPPGIAFDAGRGAPELTGCQEIFLTHGHLDHALGVPFLLSQRSLHRSGEARVFCPHEVAGPLGQLVGAAARLEGADYRYQIVPLADGDRVEVAKNLSVEAFATDHVVPSLGYHLVRRKHRLAPAFRELTAPELVSLKEQGTEIEVVSEDVWFSYCGDTGPGVFEMEPRLFLSEVLAIECTFLTPGLEERGALYRHIHLEDMVEREERFRNRIVILHHLSRRHRPDELRKALEERLPHLAARVRLLGGQAGEGRRRRR